MFELLKGAGPEVDRNAINFVKSFGWDRIKKNCQTKIC